MTDISAIIAAGSAHPYIYLPVALLLGALHALEPGHAKSLMAAFLIANRGTAPQAVLLGLAAAVGHTIVVWVLVLAGLYFGDTLFASAAEPWLLIVSGLAIWGMAIRITWQWRRPHDHQHHHHHDNEGHSHSGHDHVDHHHGDDTVAKGVGRPLRALDILWFGFTGGIIPCPAAIAVLIICLQLRQVTLGVTMVAAFSIGLALALIAVGLLAVATMRFMRGRVGRGQWMRRVPVLSAGLLLLVGGVSLYRGASLLF